VQDAAAAASTFCLGRWKEAVRGTATVSRLHVLLGILEACIRWDKSAENAVSSSGVQPAALLLTSVRCARSAPPR